MGDSNTAAGPYAAVLADLRAKRAKIDNTIKILEELSGLALAPGADGGLDFMPTDMTNGIEETAGMFLGMSIVEASKKLLTLRKKTMGNVDIARELQEGGLVMTSKDPVNTVGSVLTRRFNDVGDVVKVGRGIWGLKEWYPGRNFKTSKGTAAGVEGDRASADEEDTGSLEPNPPTSEVPEFADRASAEDDGNV